MSSTVPGQKLKQLRPLPQPWHLGGPENRIFPEPLRPAQERRELSIPQEQRLHPVPRVTRIVSLPVGSAQQQDHVPVFQSLPTAVPLVNGGGGGGGSMVPLGPLDGPDSGVDINSSEEQDKSPQDDHETTLVLSSRNHSPL